MTEDTSLSEIYKLDEQRLYDFYERIKKRYQDLSEIEIAAKFLVSQSIGPSESEIQKILKFFRNKEFLGIKLLDFIFEWVRAQKIRLEYKRYIILQEYPGENINLAIDDSISRFFLAYDIYLRNVIKKEIPKYIFAVIYKIFFYDYENNAFDLLEILEQCREGIPPELFNNDHSNIIILRLGLKEIIKKDYQRIIQSRKDIKDTEDFFKGKEATEKEEEEDQFNFSLLEKILKTYFIKKKKINPKEIEKAAVQLLNSYFKFSKIYAYKEFNQKLLDFLTENLFESFIQDFRAIYNRERLEQLISRYLKKIEEVNKDKKLGGVAWVHDLTPIITELMINVFEELLDFNILKQQKASVTFPDKSNINIENIKRKIKSLQGLSIEECNSLNLDLEQFRIFLESILEETDLSIIKKRNYLRKHMDLYRANKKNKRL